MKTPRVHHAARRRGGGWPLAARAQQPERMRRIGVLMHRGRGRSGSAGPLGGVSAGAGSTWAGPIGRNVRIDIRWAAADAAEIRRHAAELVALAPDVILANGTADRGAVAAGDPHRADRVRSRRRSGRRRLRRKPGAAGRQRHRLHRLRIRHEREMAGTAQRDRAGRDASGGPSGPRQLPRDSASSPPSRPWRRRSGSRSTRSTVRDAGEIERAVAAFARSPNGGLIVTASAAAITFIAT